MEKKDKNKPQILVGLKHNKPIGELVIYAIQSIILNVVIAAFLMFGLIFLSGFFDQTPISKDQLTPFFSIFFLSFFLHQILIIRLNSLNRKAENIEVAEHAIQIINDYGFEVGLIQDVIINVKNLDEEQNKYALSSAFIALKNIYPNAVVLHHVTDQGADAQAVVRILSPQRTAVGQPMRLRCLQIQAPNNKSTAQPVD